MTGSPLSVICFCKQFDEGLSLTPVVDGGRLRKKGGEGEKGTHASHSGQRATLWLPETTFQHSNGSTGFQRNAGQYKGLGGPVAYSRGT